MSDVFANAMDDAAFRAVAGLHGRASIALAEVVGQALCQVGAVFRGHYDWLLRFHFAAGGTENCRSRRTDYAGFITLIGSLYIVSSGIHLRAGGVGAAGGSTLFLALGGLASNLLGTMGASM